MIAYIEGILTEKNPTSVVIDNKGIGYAVFVSLNTYTKLPAQGAVCKLFTHLQIKEDAHTLYGFAGKEERELFRLLISVSGIGANTAQMLLSSANPSELQSWISSGNVSALQAVKGIGAKTAQRLIIELKDKLIKSGLDVTVSAVSGSNVRNEALSALVSLGFAKPTAEKAVDKILKTFDGEPSIEVLIKEALKML
ncbi:MAG: Holliday junction branch migration protein RuvA [Bacteroidales bacterium]|jgi:Holliday junction DNA helicase RuvA|nr:Holliday junction branch migration protein RuvA [Bacteroidales bacterium]